MWFNTPTVRVWLCGFSACEYMRRVGVSVFAKRAKFFLALRIWPDGGLARRCPSDMQSTWQILPKLRALKS
jgi:hypothetical protein